MARFERKKVCVIGLGYIGLPTAAILADAGHMVLGVDVDSHVVEETKKGIPHINEPGLSELLKRNVKNGRLTASTTATKCDVFIICVPTPFRQSESIPAPNLDIVFQATESLIDHLESGNMVVLESTSPVGTTLKLAELIKRKASSKKNLDIDIGYCPERVIPGNILSELLGNDRIVGGVSDRATKNIAEFYESFVSGEVLQTNSSTAEMCKLAENSFRDVNIAFANELSLICEEQDVDVRELIELANRHPRVDILQPGVGVGGHCIAVDPWFLVSAHPDIAKITACARLVNDQKPYWVAGEIEKEFFSRGKRKGADAIALLGLAFKPDVDDLRGSPSLEVLKHLSDSGHRVVAVEPNIKTSTTYNLADISDVIENCDFVAILVMHKEFVDRGVVSALQEKGALDYCGLLRSFQP